jgi:uncharacterized protein (DUF433 family)
MHLPPTIVTVDPEVLGGTPVFTGTRVPVATLYDYLEAGDGIGEFMLDFPGVAKAQIIALLEAHPPGFFHSCRLVS